MIHVGAFYKKSFFYSQKLYITRVLVSLWLSTLFVPPGKTSNKFSHNQNANMPIKKLPLLLFLLLWGQALMSQNCEDPNSTFEFVGSQNTYFCEGPNGEVTVDITVDQNNDPACIDNMKLEWGDGTVENLGSNFFGNKSHIYNFPDSVACSLTPDELNPEVKLTLYFKNGRLNKRTQSLAISPLPRATFTTSGSFCVGSTINFTNTGCWGDNFLWSFGNGQTATTEDASTSYSAPGQYTVRLIVSNECGADTFNTIINIRDRPNISSLAATKVSGCVPFTTKLSANASGINLNGYEWKVISSPNNCGSCAVFVPVTGKDSIMPVLQINGPAGDYTVRLIGSNECGNDTATIVITAFEQPGLAPLNIPPGCDSLIVTFDAGLMTYSGSITQYIWTFPPGASINSSSLPNPGAVKFTQSDTILLELRGPCDTIIRRIPITVNSRDPVSFGNLPSSICNTSAPFQLSATPTGGSFSGTGITNAQSGLFNPALAGPGTYTITYAQGVPGCQSEGTIPVTVLAAEVPDIGPDLKVCRDAMPLTLTASTGPGQWSGNGISGNIFNPSLANIGNNEVHYQFTNTQTGCIADKTKNITVVAIPGLSVPDTIYSCDISTPLDLVTLGNITFSPAPGSSDSLKWSGNGVDNSGMFISPGIGNHPVTLQYIIEPGCDTSRSFVVKVAPFVAAQAGADTTICSSQGDFNPIASPAGGIWKNSSGVSVTPPFNLSPGNYTFRYTIQAGTPCESSDEVGITVVGGNAVNAGANQKICETASVLNLMSSAGQQWSGPSLNGNTIDIQALNPGTYTYTLTDATLPPACNSDELMLEVAIQPSAQFGLPDTACIGQSVVVQPIASAVEYVINWGDGSAPGSSLNHTYVLAGKYTVTLVVNTYNGASLLCTNTATQDIYIVPAPQLFDFSPSANEGCAPLTISFDNKSIAEEGQYFWDFGNGQTFQGKDPGSITFEQGIEDTVYLVRLRLITRCDTMTLEKSIKVRPQPKAAFGYSYPLPCSGSPIKLNITSVGNPQKNSILSSEGHSINANIGEAYYLTFYTDTLPKVVGIWVITENDCGIDTAYQEITVQPADVVALINIGQDSTVLCPGDQITLRSFSTPGAQLRWKDLNTNTIYTGDSLTLSYSQPGVYYVVLYAERCGYDSTLLKVRVRNPPSVSISSDQVGCPGTPIQIDIVSNAGTTVSFPDGSSSSNAQHFTRVFQLPSGSYPLSVVATDQYGCTATAQTQFYLGMPPEAIINPVNPACAESPFTVSQSSTGAATFIWNLDNRSFDGPQFSTSIAQGGIYPLVLIAKSPEGCPDTAFGIVNILSKPDAAGNYTILKRCTPAVVLFSNTSSNLTDFEWRFSDNTSSGMAVLEKTFVNGGQVTATLIASNEGICFDTLVLPVYLPQTPVLQFDLIRHCSVDSSYTLSTIYPPGYTVTLFGKDSSWVNTFLIEKLPAGQYDLEVISDEGCIADTTLTLFPIQELIIKLPPDTTILLGDEVLIETKVNQPNLQFRWYPELDLDDAEIQSPLSRPRQDRRYTVAVKNSLGCIKIDSIYIDVLVDYDSLVYLPNAFTPGDQNGANDYFGARSLNEGVEMLEYLSIYDLDGNRVFHAENCPPNNTRFDCQWDGTFRGNKAEAGIYKVFYALRYIDGYVVRKQKELILIR